MRFIYFLLLATFMVAEIDDAAYVLRQWSAFRGQDVLVHLSFLLGAILITAVNSRPMLHSKSSSFLFHTKLLGAFSIQISAWGLFSILLPISWKAYLFAEGSSDEWLPIISYSGFFLILLFIFFALIFWTNRQFKRTIQASTVT